MNNLVLRSITGVVFVAVLVSATLFNTYSLFVLYLLIGVLSLWEFYGITTSLKISPNKFAGTTLGAGFQILAFLHASGLVPLKFFALLIPIVLLLFIAELYRVKELPFNGLAYTLAGVMYVSVPFGLIYYIAMPAIASSAFQPMIVISLLVMVWTNDTGAYLSGMTFGRTKLFERISPKKTWEGAVGGMLLVLGASYLLAQYLPVLSLTSWLVLGFIVSVSANFGDLVESMLKRSIGVKDSGKMLPGHGGMLDRFDGVIFAIPAFFTYLQLVN